MPENAALRATVRGLVQMVGFRFFTIECAQRCGVRGWVRNAEDGSVEIEASGPRPALEAFLGDLREGPRHARVTGVDVTWLDPPPEHHEFTVRH